MSPNDQRPGAVSATLETVSAAVGEPLALRLTGSDLTAFRHAQYAVAKIERDEDAWVLTRNLPLAPRQDGTLALPTEDLLPGLYRLTTIVLMTSDAADPQAPGSETIRLATALFEARPPLAQAHSPEELLAQYQKVLQQRRADFLAGIGDASPDSIEFAAFLFIRNCLLHTPMRVGTCELIPLGGLGCRDEIATINDFLARHGAGPIASTDEAGRSMLEQPCLVVRFPRVLAASASRAGEILHEEATRLCDVLALHRQSYGAAFAGILIRRDTGERFHWLDVPLYRGNIAGGPLAGEDPRAIRAHLEAARAKPRTALYLSLLREALREERTEFAYFRFWNLLETIARSKSFEGRPRLGWTGQQKLSSQGTPLTIDPQAEQLVFELLRSTLAPQDVSHAAFGNHLDQGTFEELVPIWYRHRNCVVHGGGCFPDDASFCLRHHPRYVACRNAHLEMVGQHKLRAHLNDQYLIALRETAILIVRSEH